MLTSESSDAMETIPGGTLPSSLQSGSTPAGRSRWALFASRLGGVVGLLAVALALALGFGLLTPAPAVASILSAVTNLGAVIWLAGIAAIQWHRLGRLGSVGTGAAMVGLAAIVALQLMSAAAGADPGNWASTVLAGPAILLVYTAILVLFVWGVLALGTTSLRTGVLPRGAIVLWTVGLMAAAVSSWLPASLANAAGIVWSSIILLRRVPVEGAGLAPDAKASVPATAPVVPDTGRLIPLDALRGTIMALMAIDHASLFVRRWHPFETWDQPLPDYPSVAAMLTRLATHPCAPAFFFLMGAGMVLFAQSRRQLRWSEGRIARHLALRGLLFIALEQLIVDVASAGQINPFDFSILAGLGAAMLFGILFLRMSAQVQAAAGAAILLLMQFLPGLLLHADLGVLSPIRLLILPGSVGIAYVLYPPIPWLGVALLGMAFARLLLRHQDRAYRVAAVVGLACLALFPLVRAPGGFGNSRMPTGHTLVDFFNVVKYPPSLSFLLLSLGFDLVVLYLFSRVSSRLATLVRPVVILGQAALYFFLVHWFVYGAMGQAWPTPGGLPQTYLAWVVGLVLLYPVCKTYEAFKHRTPATSVWRMV
jgi:uncharacterized membrane protein